MDGQVVRKVDIDLLANKLKEGDSRNDLMYDMELQLLKNILRSRYTNAEMIISMAYAKAAYSDPLQAGLRPS